MKHFLMQSKHIMQCTYYIRMRINKYLKRLCWPQIWGHTLSHTHWPSQVIHTHKSIQCVSCNKFNNLGYVIHKITLGSLYMYMQRAYNAWDLAMSLHTFIWCLLYLWNPQLLIVAHQFLEVMSTIIRVDCQNTFCRMDRKFLNDLILGKHFNTK